MPLPPIKISATGTYVMGVGSFDDAYVNGVSLTISGLTGSVTVQKQQALGNIQGFTPTAYNCSYINANTDAYSTAGTAITADGQYLVSATAAVVLLNVTAVTGSFTVVVTAIEGSVGATSSGGGGGGGGGSYVPVLRYGDTGLTQLAPAGDTPPHGMFVNAQGDVLDGSPVSGFAPILIGGSDSSGNARTAPVNLASTTPVTTSTYGIQTNSVLFGNSSANTLRALLTATGFGTGGSASGVLMVCEARASAANSGTYEPVFNNLNTSILASGARTTTQTSADQTNPNHRGIKIVLDVTAGTGLSLVLTLDNKDLNSSKFYNVLTGAAVTGVSTTVYTVYPGATAVTNLTVNDIIARLFRIVVTAGNATSATYSLSYSLIV